MEPAKFVLPQVCCKCLGQAEETFAIGGEYGGYDRNSTTYRTTYFTLKAPICAQCSRGITRMKLWGVTLLVIIPTVAWLLVRFFLSGSQLAPWFVGGGIFLGICACAGFWDASKPGKVIKKGMPYFYNWEYQIKFEEANDICAESYGFMDALHRDVNRAAEEERRKEKQG